jgi:hypothetical protein
MNKSNKIDSFKRIFFDIFSICLCGVAQELTKVTISDAINVVNGEHKRWAGNSQARRKLLNPRNAGK